LVESLARQRQHHRQRDNAIKASIAQGGTGAPVGAGYLMNSQLLASYFGTSAIPADQPGGTNFAISGAVDARSPTNGNIGNLNNNLQLPSTIEQIANYLASGGGRANPNALFLISSGGNDISFANDNLTGLVRKENYLASQAGSLTAGSSLCSLPAHATSWCRTTLAPARWRTSITRRFGPICG
jgi:outer membrane lipase/esterase